MAQYRKKPVVVEAEQWNGENSTEMQSLISKKGYIVKNDGSFHIPTNYGDMTFLRGDWLVLDEDGSFGKVENDIFEATYEKV